MIDEEAILAKLFERVALVRWTRPGEVTPNTHQFITTSRRVKLFSDVPSSQQPACYQAEHGTTEGQVSGMPYKIIIEATWVVYQCVAKDASALGVVENNVILNGIRTALQPFPSDRGFADQRNTLGGLVYHCFISGRVFKDPGDIDKQGMMTIPIKLLVP